MSRNLPRPQRVITNDHVRFDPPARPTVQRRVGARPVWNPHLSRLRRALVERHELMSLITRLDTVYCHFVVVAADLGSRDSITMELPIMRKAS